MLILNSNIHSFSLVFQKLTSAYQLFFFFKVNGGLKNSVSAHTLQEKKASLENNVGMCF